jgi:2,3-bisphosphoglycerate-dependent phosphoglycerate mutase
MQLYFIRHGQSVNNARWDDPDYKESPDPILTEIGIQQAQILSEFLEKNQVIREHKNWDPTNRYGFGITHIYASLMERAVHTASYTGHRLPQIPLAAWEEIHESGGIFGRDGEMKLKGLPGGTRSWFEVNFPELALPASLDERGWWHERPQETEDECQLRAQHVWAELLARHGDVDGQPEQRVAFVSHGGFFTHLMCAILGVPYRQASNGLNSWFLISNCSISRIAVYRNGVTVCYMNRTDHLPDELITG